MMRHGVGRLLLRAALAIVVSLAGANRIAAQLPDNGPMDGSTPLHEAIRHSDSAAIKALLSRGADVNAPTRYGVTPLDLAALQGDTAIVRTLLDAGAKPNAGTPGGETPLMTAARVGRVDMVTLLLDRGAAVNAKTSPRGQTALTWAVTENHPDVVKLLVGRGANVNVHTAVSMPKGEYSPAQPGFAAGMGFVRQRALPTPDGGMTPLLFAVRDGNGDMMRLLLELGADVEQTSGNHTSPLVIAVLNGQVGLAGELLARGARPDTADDYHRAALFAAVELRNPNRNTQLFGDGRDPLDLIKVLLDKGADPNRQTDTTPVHGWMQLDPSWVNFDGQTPFIRAALSGDVEVMRVLLAHRADPKITTKEGTTALMAASGINWVPGQTYTRSQASYLEAVQLCLERGNDVNATNSLKLAAIHGAANRGWTPIIQVLADHGATLDLKDIADRTPLMFAQGTFLAVRPPSAKPEAVALLRRLTGDTAADNAGSARGRGQGRGQGQGRGRSGQ
jgi:ankyrin repeat protein